MTTSQQQIIIAMCAGEASGDLLGAHLIEALKRQYPNARFVGIGGARMKAEGFESLFEQEKLAVRGYFEVLSNLPEILGIRSSLIEELKFIRPCVFVGIDSPDFNLHVAAKLKAFGIPTLHYVSPSLWAWKAERVHKIVKQVNRVLCLFPMEPKLYEDAGGNALFVGHPLAQILPIDPDRQSAREVLKLAPHIPVIAIMPGSRVSEIEYMAPLFFQAAKLLLRDLPNAQFIVPYPTSTIREMLQDLLSKEWFNKLPIRLQAAKTELACAAADVVLVTSGTATLEVALCKRPMVISYKISPMTYALVKRKIKVPYVGLPNILLGKKVVPELLQNDATGENLAQAVLDWYRNPDEVAKLEMSFVRLHKMLLKNTDELVANAVLEEAGLLPEKSALVNEIEAVLSSSEQHVTQPEMVQPAEPKPHFAEVGVVGADGKTYADHSQVPSVAHTLAQQSADMFQEVEDHQPIQPPKKQGFLARLFGRKQATESERYAATPRLQQNDFDEFDEFDTLPETNKPKAVQSPNNPKRYVLDIDDLPVDNSAPVSADEVMSTAAKTNVKRQPNIFDKYRQQEPQPTNPSSVADLPAPKENIFSKYMNQDGTVKENIAKKDPATKPNIFDKYRQQDSQKTETSESPAASVDVADNALKPNNIFEKYRHQADSNTNEAVDAMEHAVAESFATESRQAANIQAAEPSPAVVPQPETQTATASTSSESEAHNSETTKKTRPNIFARHREKHGAPPPKKEVDLNDILGEVRNETVIAIPVADDIVIPEISLNENHEDFVVVTDPTTHKPTLLSKEQWAAQQQATQMAVEHDHLGTSPVGVVDAVASVPVVETSVVPELEVGQRVERILKPQRARPDEATQPILPKSSMAYKYAMMFQNTADVRLDKAMKAQEVAQPETVESQFEMQPEMFVPQAEMQPETFVVPQAEMQPETFMPQAEMQPETFMPQAEMQPETFMPQAEMQPETFVPQFEMQPETFVAPQVEVQPETFVVPQAEMQPETFVPQAEMQPETFVPQAEMQPETFVPQAEMQPETFVPQAEMQPETFVPQIEMQPEMVAPQVEVQSQRIAPQIEMLSEWGMPQFELPSETQPEIEPVEPVESQADELLLIVAAPDDMLPAMPTADEIDAWLGHALADSLEDDEAFHAWANPDFDANLAPLPQAIPQHVIDAVEAQTVEMQPEMVAPQVEVQPEMVAPQVEVQPEMVAPQVEMQPEMVVPQVEVQPEMVAPQVEMQPEMVAPQVEMQPEMVVPQVEVQPEMVAPQVEMQPEMVAPQVEVQPEMVAPQAEMQPETAEPVFQHTPRFSQRYPAKAGYTAANQKLFF